MSISAAVCGADTDLLSQARGLAAGEVIEHRVMLTYLGLERPIRLA